jgi:subtilase family serine protease/6-phosphogluconolactonase (cycloisomerase 2 family)
VLLSLSLLVVIAMSVAVPASATATVATVGEAPLIPAGSTMLGPVASGMSLQLEVVLPPRDPSMLASFIDEVYDPTSAEYDHFLAPGHFGPMFGATQSTIENVSSRLSSLGLTPGQVSSNDLTIPVSTTVAAAESAFDVHIDQYRLLSGRVAYANTGAPGVPASIASNITDIIGLSDVTQAIPTLVKPSSGSANPPLSSPVEPLTAGPTPCAAASDVKDAFTASELAEAYGFNTGAYSAGYLGSGETIALFELEPFSSSDISAYETCYGISTSVHTISVDGGAGTGAGVGEAALDIEDVAGLAPDATIDVYEAPNAGNGAYDEYQKIAENDTAQVVSTSWADCEPFSGSSDVDALDPLFEEMATNGQSVVAAAGDFGSEACWDGESSSDELAVLYPASDPYVTGIGGTTLREIGPPPFETVWNESARLAGAGGGGISEFWQMPSWQTTLGVNSDSSGTPCGAPAGSYCREVPDVSADADPLTGYGIYFEGNWLGIGGTSAAAPLWAAFVALADEGCSAPAGFLNPALYTHASDLNDITSGNNDLTYTGYKGGLYPATTGYDMASGLGTPTSALLEPGVLCKAPAANGSGTMTVAPTSAHVSSTRNTLTFTYTAATGGTYKGAIRLAVQPGWSSPSVTASAAGYSTSTCGTLAVSGSVIIVSGVTRSSGATCTITYGSKSSSGPGATAPPSSRTSTFTTWEKSIFSGTLTDLAISPRVTVVNAQTISFTTTAPTERAVGGPTYSVAATASSGLTVKITLDSTSRGCTLSGQVVHFTAVGTCVIDANQAGNDKYAAAAEVRQTIPVVNYDFDHPDAVSSNGTDVFVADPGNNTLTEISASTADLVRVLSGSSYAFNDPVAISAKGAYVWVANAKANTVTQIDAATGAAVKVISATAGHFDDPDSISSDGTHVWVANYTGNTVSELSASTGDLVADLSGASYDFSELEAISSDGTHVWVADDGYNFVTEIDASTGAVVQVLTSSSYGFDTPWAISSDGTHVWVVNEESYSVTEIDASTGALVGVISSADGDLNAPTAISSDGTHVWVVNGYGSVSELSASTGDRVASISGSFADPTAIFSDGTDVWVTNYDDTVTELNATTGAVVRVISN